MSAEPRPTKVPPHAFDEDPNVPPDWTGRRTCRCHLIGEAGDQHHPVDAEPLSSTLLPPTPEPAREIDTRRLGERPDEEAA
jgi:hypothetical protein